MPHGTVATGGKGGRIINRKSEPQTEQQVEIARHGAVGQGGAQGAAGRMERGARGGGGRTVGALVGAAVRRGGLHGGLTHGEQQVLEPDVLPLRPLEGRGLEALRGAAVGMRAARRSRQSASEQPQQGCRKGEKVCAPTVHL